MAVNKNAQLRYKVLDECFSNPIKKFTIEALMERCAEALTEHYGKPMSISRRQIIYDMDFMKSAAGYDAPIVINRKESKKGHYHYSDKDFSILKKPITEEERSQIQQAIETLSRMKNLPGLDWVNSLTAKLQFSIDSEKGNRQIMSFEENEYLWGVEFLDVLYQYIIKKQPLKVTYQSYKQKESSEEIISPYYLKQFNNRWFFFGYNHKWENLQNMALDRIRSIKSINEVFIENTVDMNEYFVDIVGVTNLPDVEPEIIKIKVSDYRLPFIISKPLHGSQLQKITDNIVTLKLKVNKELISLILSFGDDMEVLEPAGLREVIKEKVNGMKKLYK